MCQHNFKFQYLINNSKRALKIFKNYTDTSKKVEGVILLSLVAFKVTSNIEKYAPRTISKLFDSEE